MSIPFKNIPSALRVPLFFAEFDNSMANSAQANQRALIIGQITAAGTAVPNVPIISQGVGDAITQGGPGSMLALMTAAYRAADNFGEVWYLPLADDPTATAASGTITTSTATTRNGTLYRYIAGNTGHGGFPITLPVTSTQTPAQIATAMAAAINATPNLPVTAAAALAVVTLTALNKGAAGNDIDIRFNYLGARGGQQTPVGLTFTIVPMSGGAVNPTALPTALANLASQPFDFIVCPYTDTTSLAALATLLNDQTGRWSWDQQIYGHVFAAYRGTLGNQTTFGAALNNQHTTVLGFNDSPTPNWLIAADLAATAAVSLRADPATPLQTLALSTMQPPPLQSRFALSDQNTLLYTGISTFTVDDAGTVRLQNVITTYQKNAFGQPDNSYLEVETMFTLMAVVRDMAVMVTSKFARMKLAANGTRFAAGSNIVTPNIVRAAFIAEYQHLEFDLGWVQDSTAFAQNLIVQQSTTNPNRVDVLWPGTLINQLRILALLAQFRL